MKPKACSDPLQHANHAQPSIDVSQDTYWVASDQDASSCLNWMVIE
jgi:hypothetical protein